MPPKEDPYASRSTRVHDLILIAFVIVVVLFTIYTAPQQRPNPGAKAAGNTSDQSQERLGRAANRSR